MTESNQVSDDWTLYEGVWGYGLPILLRVRNGLNDRVSSVQYPTRYMVTWTLAAPREDGFPSAADMDALEQFENSILDALEAGEHSICVAVVTNNGERDWIFYTADAAETHARLNQTLQNAPRCPIRPMACPDPDWDEFRGILANIEKLGR